MSELSLHNIKKIDIKQQFIGEKTEEFATIRIFVESPDDPDVKKFKVCFFINNDTEMNITNLLLAHNHGRVNPAPPKSEDPPKDPDDLPIDEILPHPREKEEF